MAWLAYLGYTAVMGETNLTPTGDNQLFLALGWLAIGLVVGTILGLVGLLVIKRDLAAAYVVVMGVITGLVAAALAAPIAATVYGGVTGSGTDFLVLVFRQAGADIQAATLGQSFLSDPIDKVTTFFVVYIILGAMAVRSKARFPQGEYLIERPADAGTGP
jgi:energy-coupling factor transport system substrate-specific component